MERATIEHFQQFLHQIVASILGTLFNIGLAIVQVLRDQVWQGIVGVATIISLLLTTRGIFSEKSKGAEIEQLKLLLREGVMYHQTAPPKPQRQKAPLSKMLLRSADGHAFFYSSPISSLS
jgi:hypothetical protein